MQEVKMDNLELFYDVLDESNNFLYEIFHKPYFELLEMTVRNILAGEVVCDIDDLDKELEAAKGRNELSLIEVKCSIGAREDLGRPTTTALENKQNFMEYLETI